MTPYVVGLIAMLVVLCLVFPDRMGRALALIVSAYRHKKQIDAGTETPEKHALGFTISQPIDAKSLPKPPARRSTPRNDSKDLT